MPQGNGSDPGLHRLSYERRSLCQYFVLRMPIASPGKQLHRSDLPPAMGSCNLETTPDGIHIRLLEPISSTQSSEQVQLVRLLLLTPADYQQWGHQGSTGEIHSVISYAQAHIYIHFQNHYNEFSFAVHIWRHLKQLKRAGRMNDPIGVMNMGPGDLVPKCPACPFPGRNLPPDWKLIEPARRFFVSHCMQ
jgi:hypothetical protein